MKVCKTGANIPASTYTAKAEHKFHSLSLVSEIAKKILVWTTPVPHYELFCVTVGLDYYTSQNSLLKRKGKGIGMVVPVLNQVPLHEDLS